MNAHATPEPRLNHQESERSFPAKTNGADGLVYVFESAVKRSLTYG